MSTIEPQPPVAVTLSSIGNAAFGDSDDERRMEVARLLREAADAIEAGADRGKLLDYNGNAVGTFNYTPRS